MLKFATRRKRKSSFICNAFSHLGFFLCYLFPSLSLPVSLSLSLSLSLSVCLSLSRSLGVCVCVCVCVCLCLCLTETEYIHFLLQHDRCIFVANIWNKCPFFLILTYCECIYHSLLYKNRKCLLICVDYIFCLGRGARRSIFQHGDVGRF